MSRTGPQRKGCGPVRIDVADGTADRVCNRLFDGGFGGALHATAGETLLVPPPVSLLVEPDLPGVPLSPRDFLDATLVVACFRGPHHRAALLSPNPGQVGLGELNWGNDFIDHSK